MAKLIIVIMMILASGCGARKMQTSVDVATNVQHITHDSSSIQELLTKIVKTDGVITEESSQDVKVVANIVTEDLDTAGRIIRRQTVSVELQSAANSTRIDSTVVVDSILAITNATCIKNDSTVINATTAAVIEEEVDNRPSFIRVMIVLAAILGLVYVYKRIFLF